MKLIAILALLAGAALAQNPGASIQLTNAPPPATCGSQQMWLYQPSGTVYSCVNGVPTPLSATPGAVPSAEALGTATNVIPLRAALDGAYGSNATVVFIGDSITQGAGAPTYSTSYTPKLTQALQQAYGNGQPAGTGFCSAKDATANASGCLITLSGSWTAVQGVGPSQTTSPAFSLVYENGASATATTVFPAGNDTIVLYCYEYTDSSAGFTVTIDGNSVASACAANTASYTPIVVTYNGLNPLTPHTIVATAPNTGNGYLFGYQGLLSTSGVTMMNVAWTGATSGSISAAANVSFLANVPNLAAIFVALGQNDSDLTGATTVANLAAVQAEAATLKVPIVYVITENDSVNHMNSIEPAIKAWANSHSYSWISVADYWGLYANAPTSLYNSPPHPSQAGHYDIANLILNQLRLTPPLAANAAPLFQRTIFTAMPTSDIICAHAGDSINSLTCTNAADAAGVYKNFATVWTLPLNLWATNRIVQLCGQFEYWSSTGTPTVLIQLIESGTQLYAPSGAITPGTGKTANGFTACWQMASTSAAGTSVFTEPLNYSVFPTQTNQGQAANGIAQPKNIGNNAYPIAIGVQYSSTGIASGTYTSGITAVGTAGQTCLLSVPNNGNTNGAATVALTGLNTIAGSTALVITNTGYGSTSAATSYGTVAAGTASSCTGTATVATTLGGAQGNGLWLQAMWVTEIN